MENRVFGNQGKKMLKNNAFNFSSFDNGANEALKNKIVNNIITTKFFFLLGVWCCYVVALSVFAILTAFLLSNLSFMGTIAIKDILSVYAVAMITFFVVRLFPLR